MLGVVLHSLQGSSLTQGQGDFATQAVRLLTQVVNAPQFIALVRGGHYSSALFQTDIGTRVQLSAQQLANLILMGKEQQQIANKTIDLQVTLAPLPRGVLGQSQPPNPRITTNTLYFDEWFRVRGTLSLAAHWLHEWLHVAGLLHVGPTPDRADAVYQIAEMVVQIGRQLLENDLWEMRDLQAEVPGQGYLDVVRMPSGGKAPEPDPDQLP